MDERAKLESVYRHTNYVVQAPAGAIAIRIDQSAAELDALLNTHGAPCWVYLTAHNPGSRKLTTEQNEQRHAELVALISELGYVSLSGQAIGDAGDWPAEASLFVLGMSESDALRLARHFDQLAFVSGEQGKTARLIWV